MSPESPKPVRVGVIGIGYWGPNVLRNIADLPETQLRWVCDKIPDRLEKAARRYPGARITEDVQNLFDDPELDAVAIVTPVSTHYPLARQALMAGKHVFIEKPLSDNVRHAEALTELAAKKKLRLMVDHVFVYSPPVQKMKQVIDKGELGEIYYFDSVRVNLGLFQKDVNVIWDLAPHDLSIMDFLLNRKARSVSATAVRHLRGSGMEDLAYIVVRYADDLIGHIHVNWLAPAKIRSILLGGSKRMIVYDDMDPSEKVKIYDKGVKAIKTHQQVEYRLGDMWAPQLDTTEALRLAVRHFARCVQEKKTPLTDGAAGVRVVRLLDAANRSARQGGREIKL